MTAGPTPVDEIRDRARLLIAYGKPEEVLREATEVRRWFLGMTSFFPEKTFADLLPIWLAVVRGGGPGARASSYFALEALHEFDSGELDRANTLVELAERASKEESLNRFSVSARARDAGSRDKNRPPDELTVTIAKLLSDEPKLTWKGVLKRLEDLVNDNGPILSVTDKMIEWETRSGKVKESPISGLKDRCTSARKLNRRDADSGESG